MISVPNEYTYIYDIYNAVRKGVEVNLDELNLVGGRKSGKSSAIILLFYILAKLPVQLGLVAFRSQYKQQAELFRDFVKTYKAYGLPFRAVPTQGSIYIGQNEIRIIGLNSLSKDKTAQTSGLGKFANAKYIFRFFEERFQFTEDNISDIVESVRGITKEINSNLQIVDINSCNPWAKSSPYISYCALHQNWDLKQLKLTGSQIGKYLIPVGKGKETLYKRVIFHYTNWRVAKDYLSRIEIMKILDTWSTNKKRAATVDYGLPGYEDGAIYTHLLDNLAPTIIREQTWLLAGVDYGWGRNARSGKTVALFCGATMEDGIDVYGEYNQDNHKVVKSPDVVAEEIVRFYFYEMKSYIRQIGEVYFLPLKVRVDNMSVGLIQILNSTSKKYGFRWLTFQKSVKFPVNDRIAITLGLMSKFMLRLNDKVDTLKGEFELAHYIDGDLEKRAKVNDHALNAFEYAIEPVMYKFSQELNMPDKTMKRRNIFYGR